MPKDFFAQTVLVAVRGGVKRTCCEILLALLPASIAVAAADLQSLAEVARKEAERRQRLDQQGIQEKRIEIANPADLAPGGAISTSAGFSGLARPSAPAQKAEPRATLRSFQTRLQKLDRDIRASEDRLKLLRTRAETERRSAIRTGKGSKGSGSSSPDQLRWQILELEGKLAQERQERDDVFQAGKKAGYLPGELEGRGIVR